MEFKIGMIVKSVAGHDKDRFYVIIGLSGNRAYIADGKVRKLESLKSKNLIHVKKTNEFVDLSLCKTNKALRRALHKFNYEDFDENSILEG